MRIYRVPLRVSFTGCVTDVPARIGYYTGAAVCASIDKYVEVRITTNNHEPSFIEPSCDLIEDLLEKFPFQADIPRMQIRWTADIPLGSGLGGSSALLVAVAKHFFLIHFIRHRLQVKLNSSATRAGRTLLGSGGGGHYLLVIDPTKREKLNEIVETYNYQDIPFRFEK